MARTLLSGSEPYARRTASMLGDPEAHRFGDASVSSSSPRARCFTDGAALDWVPLHEHGVVPATLRQLCVQCPVRQWCLDTAVTTDSEGYWAGTTTDERILLRRTGPVTVTRADALRGADTALHAPGEESRTFYRKGCRCRGCRWHHARVRAQERSRCARRALSSTAA